MTIRTTPADLGARGLASDTRGIVTKTDDSKKLQEVDINMLADEKQPAVERFQDYGITSYLRKPTQDSGGGSSGGGNGGGGGGQQQKQKSAEHISLFLGSERTHAVVIKADDRRFRIYKLEEGEVALYDDQQQKVHIRRHCVLTRSQFKIAMRVVKDEQQAEEKASRDQSQQDVDNGGGSGSGTGTGTGTGTGGGGGTISAFAAGNGGGQQSGGGQKTKPLSSYIADKDSITLIRQKEGGDMLSQLELKIADDQSGSGAGGDGQKDKIELKTPLPLDFLIDEKKKQIKSTTPKNTVQLQEQNPEIGEQNTRIFINSTDDQSLIQIETNSTFIEMDEEKKTITIDSKDGSGKVKIFVGADKDSDSPPLGMMLDNTKQKILLGDFQASQEVAIKGTIDTAGHADIIKMAKKVLVT